EQSGTVRGPRDAFQRDRDRIIHSISFRRLRHKTQVFMAPDGDHFRVRLTHSLEVAQIGRTIARALGLNEDLTEALCLAPDIAYDNHDIDDGLRAGLLSLDQLMQVPMIADGWRRVEAKFPGVPARRLVGELIRSQIGEMVNDLIGTTQARLVGSGIETVDDV